MTPTDYLSDSAQAQSYGEKKGLGFRPSVYS